MDVNYLSAPLAAGRFNPGVVALGDFDGLHAGHQEVIRRAGAMAEACKAELSVMTFSPHPRFVLGQDERYRHELTPLEDKIRLLARLGVGQLFVIEFTKEFASIGPEEFVRGYLLPIPVKGVVAGFDFRFGHGGQGTADELADFGLRYGFETEIVAPVVHNGMKVSSSQIRECLSGGKVEDAAALLARPYEFQGIVEHGDKRGRLLGFPTANLRTANTYILPAGGVYVTHVFQEQREDPWVGVMNIGTRPTFHSQGQPSVEVHLLDFSGDLYGQSLRVQMLHRLRAERKFDSVSHLVRQLQTDVSQAREFILCSF